MTYLYIKQHSVTGLRYFGKTKNDPLKYTGSGTHWKRHIKLHGKTIDTIWKEKFHDEALCQEFAEFFSDFFDIVNDKAWANLTIENGIDGRHDQAGEKNGNYGNRWTQEQKDFISRLNSGKKQSAETIARRVAKTTGQKRPKQSIAISGASNPNYGKPISAETKAKMSATHKARWAAKKEQV